MLPATEDNDTKDCETGSLDEVNYTNSTAHYVNHIEEDVHAHREETNRCCVPKKQNNNVQNLYTIHAESKNNCRNKKLSTWLKKQPTNPNEIPTKIKHTKQRIPNFWPHNCVPALRLSQSIQWIVRDRNKDQVSMGTQKKAFSCYICTHITVIWGTDSHLSHYLWKTTDYISKQPKSRRRKNWRMQFFIYRETAVQEYTEGAPSTGTLSRKWTRGPVTQMSWGGGGGQQCTD